MMFGNIEDTVHTVIHVSRFSNVHKTIELEITY